MSLELAARPPLPKVCTSTCNLSQPPILEELEEEEAPREEEEEDVITEKETIKRIGKKERINRQSRNEWREKKATKSG